MFKQRTLMVLAAVGLFLLFLVSPFYLISDEGIYFDESSPDQVYEVALVFGAGLNASGRPSDILSDRLIVAADLYFSGHVEKILLSAAALGEGYSETAAMQDFLLRWGVPGEALLLDEAGFSTIDSCRRAAEEFGFASALLVTQDFHLPRASFLCRSFGLETRGVSASLQPYIKEAEFEFREKLANYKAILEVYVFN